jgi:hypothetical protein
MPYSVHACSQISLGSLLLPSPLTRSMDRHTTQPYYTPKNEYGNTLTRYLYVITRKI